MSPSPTLVGTLDPTYSLLPQSDEVLLPASDLNIYLRLFYLFIGAPIVPRTFFIHGRTNPFYNLYSFGDHGKKELKAFLTSGVAHVSGHSHPKFASFSGHFQSTAKEQHPLIVDDKEHLAFAHFLDDCLPPDQRDLFIWQDFKLVIAEFPAIFRECFLQLGGIDDAFNELDRAARHRLAERNKVNEVQYPEDRWGRNEICDLLKTGPYDKSQDASRMIQAAVAAYQKTFATTVPSGVAGPKALLASPSRIRTEPEETDFAWALTNELSRESIWEIGLEILGSRPWSEISHLGRSLSWQRWLTDYDEAIASHDRKKACFAMEQLATELAKLYPPKKSMRTGWMQVVIADPTSVVGPISKVASTTLKAFLRFFSEPTGGATAEEKWFSLSPELLDTAATWVSSIRKIVRAQRRHARFEYLYDWRTQERRQ